MSTLSVIVPVYKTEKYLKKCVDSILASSYSDLDVILVDDGSPDGSGAICDGYAEKDSRVRVIHKQNGGLSSARNAGVDNAYGEYITFVDSDDYIDPDIYSHLISLMEKSGVSVGAMGIAYVTESEEPSFCKASACDGGKIVGGEDMLCAICRREEDCSVCNKIFRREVFCGLKFPQGKLNEDFHFFSELLITKDVSFVISEAVGYYYFKRSGSITNSGFGKTLCDAVYNTEGAKRLAARRRPELVSAIGAYAAYQARTALLVMTREQYKAEADFVGYCREVIKDNKKYLKGSFMQKKDRLCCSMYIRFPKFTKKLFDLLRRGR